MSARGSMVNFPPVLRRIAVIMTVMMAASFVFTLSMTNHLHLHIVKYGFPWIGGGFQFCDFHVFQERSMYFRTAAYWKPFDYPFTYPAFDAVLFAMIYKLPHPLKTYLIVLPLEMAAWVWWMAHGLSRRGLPADQMAAFALVILCSCWPGYYVLDTANLEGLVVFILALGTLAVLRGYHWTGATLITLAGAMKLYPLVLLALLLSKHRYKQFGYGVVLFVTLTVGSLAILGPSTREAQAHLNVGTDFLRKNYIVLRGATQLNFSHALFNPLKFGVLLVDRLINHDGHPASPAHEQALLDGSLRVYLVAMAVLGTGLYFGRIRKLPMLNQLFALVVCAVLLTPFSSDYTLLHLLMPFGLLCFYTVEAWRSKQQVPGLQTCFVCVPFILAFETFFTWKYAFASSIRALALCVLLIAVLRNPFRWSELDEALPASNGTPA